MKLEDIEIFLQENSVDIGEENWKKFSELFGDCKIRIQNVSKDHGELIHRFLKENDRNLDRSMKNKEKELDVFVIKDGDRVASNEFSPNENAIICFKNEENNGRSWDVFFYIPNTIK